MFGFIPTTITQHLEHDDMTKLTPNINEFCTEVSKLEGKKKSVDIAQISEVIRIANDLLDGQLYELILQKR